MDPKSVCGMCEAPRSEGGWAWYLSRRTRSGEGRWVRWTLFKFWFDWSMRLDERAYKITEAAAAMARANRWREGIYVSTTWGLLKLASHPSFMMPSLGSCGRGVCQHTSFEAVGKKD